MIRVPEPHLEAIRAQAESAYPRECCGVLLGVVRGDDGAERREVVRPVPLDNAWEGAQERRYLIPAETMLVLEREALRERLEIIGAYHSHPDHPAVPSTFDREHAWPWYVYLIIPVEGGQAGALRAWRLADDRSAFREEAMQIKEDS